MARILFVDDNADFARTSSAVLQAAGHAVVLAENGAVALQRADLDSFDLVISDILMPEKEGFETIITLRRQFPKLAIIAVSGGGIIAAREYLRSATAFGANLALEKPFSGLELVLAVEKVLRPPPLPSHTLTTRGCMSVRSSSVRWGETDEPLLKRFCRLRAPTRPSTIHAG